MALTRTAMRNRIKAITAGFRAANEVVEVKQTEKSKQIVDLCQKIGYSCDNPMIKILEIISNESISPFMRITGGNINNPKFAKPLVCIVSKVVMGSVKIGDILVLTDKHLSFHISPKGQLTNQSLYSTEVRLATDEEIDKLTDAQLDYLIKEYTA